MVVDLAAPAALDAGGAGSLLHRLVAGQRPAAAGMHRRQPGQPVVMRMRHHQVDRPVRRGLGQPLQQRDGLRRAPGRVDQQRLLGADHGQAVGRDPALVALPPAGVQPDAVGQLAEAQRRRRLRILGQGRPNQGQGQAGGAAIEEGAAGRGRDRHVGPRMTGRRIGRPGNVPRGESGRFWGAMPGRRRDASPSIASQRPMGDRLASCYYVI